MNTKILKSILLITTSIFLFSCVNDDYTEPKSNIKTYELSTTTTVSNVKVLAVNIPDVNPPINPPLPKVLPTLYTADDIIEAYVTSSDETGNFYNSISFQTIPTNNSVPVGFSVSVDLKSATEGFIPGRKVYIKLKGLYVGNQFGSLKIGSLYENEIGRIASYDWKNHLFLSSTIVAENTFVRTLTLTQAATDININTLVEIDNVQFADESLARTYYDKDNGGFATNHNIIDVNGGIPRFLRVSEFALFSSKSIPAGKGKIRGIMSRYKDDYQFLVRSDADVKLINPRNYNFSASFTENFESYAASQKAFPNYLNFDISGTKKWLIKPGNFLEMSSFGGSYEKNKTYFMVPVNMTDANTFTFQIKAAFYNGSTLKIYRSTNFNPGTKISDATLADITSSFVLPNANTSSFASAGTYTIPTNVTGNGYFIFEYSGTNNPSGTAGPVLTTTIQIDNIVIN